MGALIAIGNTAAVVGFGGVAKAVPAFEMAVNAMTSIPGSPFNWGSDCGQCDCWDDWVFIRRSGDCLAILAPHYMDMGVNTEALHRVVAISSGALDSLPHNGYVVTTVRAICGESHQDAYNPVGALTVIVPVTWNDFSHYFILFWTRNLILIDGIFDS